MVAMTTVNFLVNNDHDVCTKCPFSSAYKITICKAKFLKLAEMIALLSFISKIQLLIGKKCAKVSEGRVKIWVKMKKSGKFCTLCYLFSSNHLGEEETDHFCIYPTLGILYKGINHFKNILIFWPILTKFARKLSYSSQILDKFPNLTLPLPNYPSFI